MIVSRVEILSNLTLAGPRPLSNPHGIYDGHTLASVVPDMEKTIGNEIGRVLADAGCRGHNAPQSHRSGSSPAARNAASPQPSGAGWAPLRHRAVIGHIKAEHRMGRNYLAGQHGDALNAILAAAGYNFSLLLNWFRQLLWHLIAARQSQPNEIEA